MLFVAQGFGVVGGPGVFQVGAEGRVGQPGAAVELVVFQLGEYAKTLGVALEAEKVAAFGVAHGVQPAASSRLLEPVADGVFAGVAERRVADVMGQAGRLYDHPQVGRIAPGGQVVTQHFTHAHP